MKNQKHTEIFFLVIFQFGFKKWKSHVTSRPLSERSEVVQDLYADISELKPVVGGCNFIIDGSSIHCNR